MKSLESRVVDLERRSGCTTPIIINITFVPARDGHPAPAPAPYETLVIRINPEVPAS